MVEALSWRSRRASQHPAVQSPVHPWKPNESCPFAASCSPSKEEKTPWADISFSLRNLPVRAFDSRAQGLSTPLARRRSSCLPPSPNLVRTHPIERYQALRDSAPCLSRAATPPEGHHIRARKRRAPGNIILSQPYRRRVSTERLNREGSQLAASLGGEPGPTPAGKTLPHSYPETKSRREGARDDGVVRVA